MVPHSEINEVHTAHLADAYDRLAAHFRVERRPSGPSYADYLGSVYELSDRERSIDFQSACLLPRSDRGRPRVLLLLGNPRPEFIESGMIQAAHDDLTAFWSNLRKSGLLCFGAAAPGSLEALRDSCLDAVYDAPFSLGFAYYWRFPTLHPSHLRLLFGSDREPLGAQHTRRRFESLLRRWNPVAVICFGGRAYSDVTRRQVTDDYFDHIRDQVVWSVYRTAGRVYPVFLTYPAAWRPPRDICEAHQASLGRIGHAIEDLLTAD